MCPYSCKERVGGSASVWWVSKALFVQERKKWKALWCKQVLGKIGQECNRCRHWSITISHMTGLSWGHEEGTKKYEFRHFAPLFGYHRADKLETGVTWYSHTQEKKEQHLGRHDHGHLHELNALQYIFEGHNKCIRIDVKACLESRHCLK